MIASLIILLYLSGFIAKNSAITSLFVAAGLLLVAEVGIVSFGLLALNGLIALYAAVTLYYGTDVVFGISIGWNVLLGVAFVEFLTIIIVIAVHMWLKSINTTTGIEGMIGQKAVILDWNGESGNVRYEGEIWKAQSQAEMDLNKDDEVTIQSVGRNKLTITA